MAGSGGGLCALPHIRLSVTTGCRPPAPHRPRQRTPHRGARRDRQIPPWASCVQPVRGKGDGETGTEPEGLSSRQGPSLCPRALSDHAGQDRSLPMPLHGLSPRPPPESEPEPGSAEGQPPGGVTL